MSNIFIIHGVNENDQEHWFPWLKLELQNRGHEVFIPNFPTPDNQTLDQWLQKLEGYKTHLNKDSIIIGHSLGTLFGLHIAENHKIKAFIGVAGFGELPGNKFDACMTTFAKDFDWEKIRSNVEKSHVLHGDNDPYVKIERAENLAKNLQTEAILIPNGGHLEAADGYTEFPLLFQKITELAG